MTPEQLAQFEEMKRQLAQLIEFMRQRKEQQLTYPLDAASKAIINEFNVPT